MNIEAQSSRKHGLNLFFAMLGFSLFVIGVVLYLSKWQWACTLGLLAGSAILYVWDRTYWKAYVIAAVLGMVGEYYCVKEFDLWRYNFETWKFGLPVWIGLVWGYLFVVYIQIADVFARIWFRVARPVQKVITLTFTIFILMFLRIVFLKIGIYISYYYIAFISIMLVIWHRPHDIFTLIVAGIGGTYGEYLAIQNGLWEYTSPAFTGSGMPISLPFAWGLAGIFVRNAAENFIKSILWLLFSCAVVYLLNRYVVDFIFS